MNESNCSEAQIRLYRTDFLKANTNAFWLTHYSLTVVSNIYNGVCVCVLKNVKMTFVSVKLVLDIFILFAFSERWQRKQLFPLRKPDLSKH